VTAERDESLHRCSRRAGAFVRPRINPGVLGAALMVIFATSAPSSSRLMRGSTAAPVPPDRLVEERGHRQRGFDVARQVLDSLHTSPRPLSTEAPGSSSPSRDDVRNRTSADSR